jgi:hypothetical protein
LLCAEAKEAAVLADFIADLEQLVMSTKKG